MRMMRNFFLSALFLLMLLSMSNAYAVIGLPDKTARIGYSIGAARLDVNDPNGDTQSVYTLQPIKLMFSDWLSGGYRVWLEAYYQEASLKASESLVGQYFQQSGGRFTVQRNFAISSYFKPWLGLGMDFSFARYSLRHTKDDEGYLVDQFSDRIEPTAGALLSIVNEWQLSREWTVGGSLLQRMSLNPAVNETSLSMFFLMRY